MGLPVSDPGLAPAPLAPCIWFTRHVSARQSVRDLAGPAIDRCYNAWSVHAGSLLIGDRRPLTVRPGQVALTEPGRRVREVVGVAYDRVAFDICAQCAVPTSGPYPFRMAATGPPQPSWTELFGAALPLPVPALWQRSARALVDGLVEDAWRGRWRYLAATARLLDWLVRFAGALAADAGGDTAARAEHALVDRAEGLIAAGYRHRLTSGELAARLGVSRSTLHAAYVAQRGHGPGQAIAKRRLAAARELLRTEHHSVDHVARLVGYACGRSLARAFREAHGITPAGCRREA